MTKVLFVRHGEPDYSTVGDWANTPLGLNFASLSDKGVRQIKLACKRLAYYDASIIISSPYTRTIQGAAIMSQKLNLPIMVEHDLHEWIVDTTFSTTDPEVLAELCREHDACNGIYPNGEGKVWESTDIVRRRVLNCLKKYRRYKCIIVSGHAMMMQAVMGVNTMIGYGQIMELNL